MRPYGEETETLIVPPTFAAKHLEILEHNNGDILGEWKIKGK